MTPLVLTLERIGAGNELHVGGKAMALARIAQAGHVVPEAVCITTDTYRQYVMTTGLRERILLEVGRKPLLEMRLEELWDTSLRIRSLFLNTPVPTGIARRMTQALPRRLTRLPVAVRSSAIGEDAAERLGGE